MRWRERPSKAAHWASKASSCGWGGGSVAREDGVSWEGAAQLSAPLKVTLPLDDWRCIGFMVAGRGGFDEGADVAHVLGVMLGRRGDSDGERLGLRGRAEHVSHHLRRSDADQGRAGLREGQPVGHGVGGWSLTMEGELPGGQNGHDGGQRGHEGNRRNSHHRNLHRGSERHGGRRRRCHDRIGQRDSDGLGYLVQPAVSF